MLLLAMVCTVPALLFLNAWQAFRYEMVEAEVTRLEEHQRVLLERNKKLLIGVEVLSAPLRIESIAAADDALTRRIDRGEVHVRVTAAPGGDGG